jgi:uncharacterized metal-binding protein
MASGKNHDRSIYFTSPIVAAVSCYHAGLELGLIAGVAHLVGGLMLSPDLDLISRPFKRWGFLKIMWIPYQHFIPRHRHWLSHGVIVGSALRLLYLAAWLSPLLLVFPLSKFQFDSVNLARAIAIFVGVEISALNHLVLDGLILPLPKSVKRALKGD